MKLPAWYFIQFLIWLLTAVPIYAVAALWGVSDWWLVDNIINSDLSTWEMVLLTLVFIHPLGTLPFAIATVVRSRNIASN